jgi:Lon protease-like protein
MQKNTESKKQTQGTIEKELKREVTSTRQLHHRLRHQAPVEKSLINDKAKLCNSMYFLLCLLNELGYI